MAPFVVENSDFYSGAVPIVMNKGRYDSLPTDLREMFDEVVAENEREVLPQRSRVESSKRRQLTSKASVVMTMLSETEKDRWIAVSHDAEGEFSDTYGNE